MSSHAVVRRNTYHTVPSFFEPVERISSEPSSIMEMVQQLLPSSLRHVRFQP